jgi:glutamate-ammonia-ligase adenylyltransferase
VSGTSPSPLEGTLRSPLLCRRLAIPGAEFLEHQGAESVPRSAALRRGLAAVLASQRGAAGFVTRRSAMARRLRQLDEAWLARRARELEQAGERDAGLDLEGFLDELRLLRREDTVLAACLDLSGAVPFVEVSAFLSTLAEGIVGRALRVAEARRSHGKDAPLAVIAMGKLAGREFTYHSDLDLIFLTPGETEDVEEASRLAQRLVGYLSTMTGAGVAYPVDSRLRPSGHQGMLVTTFAGFERYQLERAEPWEHLALMRSRVIAGAVVQGQALLDLTRSAILARGMSPWRSVAELLDRVHAERGQEGLSGFAFKTGVGGIMDVEFLACGALLERGAAGAPFPPSIPAMLRAAASGAATEDLLERYAFLRELEARVRWVTDRPETSLDPSTEAFEVVAALMAPEDPAARLLERLESARREVAAAVDRVLAVGSIGGLAA